MAPFAIRLTETTGGWARAIGPVAEWVARQLWSTTHKRTQSNLPPTRLTQTRGRQAKGIGSAPIRRASPRLENPAAARRRFNSCHSITNRSVPLVRRSYSPRLPPASEALAGAGGTRGRFATPLGLPINRASPTEGCAAWEWHDC